MRTHHILQRAKNLFQSTSLSPVEAIRQAVSDLDTPDFMGSKRAMRLRAKRVLFLGSIESHHPDISYKEFREKNPTHSKVMVAFDKAISITTNHQ